MNASAFAIAVDDGLELSPYQQIVAQVRGLIERGDLPSGAALPTVRQLASDLGVAPNTVARAYADLQNDGWLVSEGRRGTRVAARLPSHESGARVQALHSAIAAFVDGLRYRGFNMTEIRHELARALES